MKNKVGAIVVCGLMTTCVSCGFKSDLYLPGQQQKIEQFDSTSLKNLGDEKLRQLQNQKVESAVPPDALPEQPEDGVVVDLPTVDDIAREKAKLRKTVVE